MKRSRGLKMDDLAREFKTQIATRQIQSCSDVKKLQEVCISLMQAYFAANEMIAEMMRADLPKWPQVQESDEA